MKKIVFTGGGTAGHVTPNIAIMKELDGKAEFFYIGSEFGIEKSLIPPLCPYYSIKTAKLIRKFTLKNLYIPFNLTKGVKQSIELLEKIKPDVVFSKGGFVSVPVVLGAKSLKIPVYTHESDLSLGLANRLISPLCKNVFTSYPETVKGKKYIYSGAILKAELFNANRENSLKLFGFDGKKPILCVLGGSQGSHAINKALRSVIGDLTPTFDILHLTGKGNLDVNLNNAIGYKQIDFTTDMPSVYSVTDIAITRAGANT